MSNVSESFEVEFKQLSKFNEKLDCLCHEQTIEHLNFTKLYMEHFFHLASKLPKVVISAREELNLKMSEDKCSSIVDSNVRKGKYVFRH